jgi:hypothetical protein
VAVEQHTVMRFAWLGENSDEYVPVKRAFTHPLNLLMVAYNVAWWIPMVLAFSKLIDYRTGIIAFLAVTVVRAIANLIRNNVLKPRQAVNFPLRAP